MCAYRNCWAEARASKKGDGTAMVISFLQKDVAAAKARMLVLQTGVHAAMRESSVNRIFPFRTCAIVCWHVCVPLCAEKESRGHKPGYYFVCDSRCAGMHVSAHSLSCFQQASAYT